MEAMDMSRLAGRVAVVTGASGGLGSAITEDLVVSGLKVVGIDVNLGNLQTLADRVNKLGAAKGGVCHPLRVDITKGEELCTAFQWIEEHLGGISVIVNNAGIAPMKPLEDSDHELMAAVLDTNVLGLAAATREAINSMEKHNITDGHVVNIGSTVGHAESVTRGLLTLFTMPMYITSKHAVIGFNRALRAQLRAQGVNVRVTDLSPGTIETPLVEEKYLQALEYRTMKPCDVSRAVRFVLSSPPHVEIVHLTIQPAGEVW